MKTILLFLLSVLLSAAAAVPVAAQSDLWIEGDAAVAAGTYASIRVVPPAGAPPDPHVSIDPDAYVDFFSASGAAVIGMQGRAFEFFLYDHAHVQMQGFDPQISFLDLNAWARAEIESGLVSRYYGRDDSVGLVTGGRLNRSVDLWDRSSLELTGGTAGRLHAHDDSLFRLVGGELGDLFASGSSRIEWTGGRLDGYLAMVGGAQLTIYGDGVDAEGRAVSQGSLISVETPGFWMPSTATGEYDLQAILQVTVPGQAPQTVEFLAMSSAFDGFIRFLPPLAPIIPEPAAAIPLGLLALAALTSLRRLRDSLQ